MLLMVVYIPALVHLAEWRSGVAETYCRSLCWSNRWSCKEHVAYLGADTTGSHAPCSGDMPALQQALWNQHQLSALKQPAQATQAAVTNNNSLLCLQKGLVVLPFATVV